MNTLDSPEVIVSVVVPARNEEKHLRLCLASLLCQDAPFNYEIIVVDNGSIDRTREIASAVDVLLCSSDARTPAGVRNDGAAVASGRYLAFIDADCTASASWLSSLIRAIALSPGRVAIGGPYVAPANAKWVARVWAPGIVTAPEGGRLLPGGNLMVESSAFRRVGGFDASLVSAEDDAISRKLMKLGMVVYDPAVAVVHHGYPDSLAKVFPKHCWHGSTQLRAHGLFGDRLLVLTYVWTVSTLMVVLSAIAGWSQLLLLCLLIDLGAVPALLSFARLRRARLADQIRFFAPALVVSVCVLAGRSVGLGLELWRLLAASRRK